jgi:hypothetical protein
VSDTYLRTAADACSAAGSTLVTPEPSHIHIPRPSRIRQSTSPQRQEPEPLLVQLVVAEEEAAA